MPFAPRYLRLVVSYTVAAFAAALCGTLGHVHVTVRDPQTWSHVLQHKCGQFMLICVAWAVIELVLAMLLPREPDFTLQAIS
jgi:putative copper export protein